MWDSPYDNEQTITAYQILINDKTGNDWNEDTINCDGSQAQIVNQRFCLVPMSVFNDPPYNLDFRDRIVAKARAYNVYGWQEAYSEPNTSGITVRREPVKVGQITVIPVLTTTT